MTGDQMIKVSEWLRQGLELFGPDTLQWRFRCPACGNVQTGAEFQALGVDPQSAYQQCIGRHTGNQPRQVKPDSTKIKSPCDYAAYGLFRFGDLVISETGKPVPVFPFDREAK
jgi:hypothetical protein